MPTKKPRNADHARRRNTPLADNEAISEHLKDLLSPAIYAQSAYYRSLGLRDLLM
ncbi:MAG: hypothetical protein VKN72_21925 [Nostocales cyanobacterium 94392]|nr:hypothetical protein [Nostocales cyanobacterium 94392]